MAYTVLAEFVTACGNNTRLSQPATQERVVPPQAYLALGWQSHEALALVGEGNDRGSGAAALGVFDDLGSLIKGCVCTQIMPGSPGAPCPP